MADLALPQWAPLDTLRDAVAGEVRRSAHDRALYATDASIYQAQPTAVVIPDSPDDAAAAIRACGRSQLAVLPRGGGTSLAGQCTNHAVVIDLSSRCTGIGPVDRARRRVRVEAGVTVDDLNDAIAPTGLFFAPDPSTSRHATIAGCIGNNAAGMHSILYGRTSENVHGIDAALIDGRRVTLDEGAALRSATAAELTTAVVDVVRRHERAIRDRFPKTLRRSAGYQLDVILAQLDEGCGDLSRVNLAHLLCASEGTLAMTLGAELALHPIPAAKGLAVIAFDDLDRAIDAAIAMRDLKPAAIELLDDLIMDLARANPVQRHNVAVLPAPSGATVRAVLYVEFFARESAAEFDEPFARIREMFGDAWVATHTEPGAMANAWALRKAGEPLLHGIPGDRKPVGFVEDNAVPPERLGEFVKRFRGIVERHGTRASFYAHASVGVLHVRPLLNLKDPDDERRMHTIAAEVADLAKELGGVMSGEHGDGRVRGPLLESYFGPELMGAFREIKAIFDPRHLMNPGNIVAPGPLASISLNTRVRPGDDADAPPARVPPVKTFYRYDDQTDFAHAVEMCNGAGVCRKNTGGTMCPSYMATRDERHSTRGRGNALRLAISGQLNLSEPGAHAWGDPDTKDTLNLCLSCKACKAECPSNVDIARLKAEFHAQSHEAAGRPPLRSLAFGHVHALNRVASITPRLATAVNRLGVTKRLTRLALGLDERRDIPAWTKPLRARWPKDSASLPASAPTVVYLADTFTQHNEPHIGLATKRVLEAFGYRVRPFWGTDFGRALMSTGLLRDAITDAERLLDRLEPMVRDDSIAGFVMTEPSCLSSVIDDWLLLGIDRPLELRTRLAGRTSMVEDFLDAHWDEHPGRPAFDVARMGVFHEEQDRGRALFHGHCHQKALVGKDSSANLLRRVLGDRVDVLDAGCCGMAGSFGYTHDRYDLSMQIGGLTLFPAIGGSPESLPIATGTSCRHQIKDGTGRTALHPVEVLERMLGG